MTSVKNTVYYCCVSKGNRIQYAYNRVGADDHPDEMEKLAALCLETIPPFHKWYFHTSGKKIFGFLMEDGYVYFAIVDESLGNSALVLQFLEHVRSEFKKVAKRSRNGSKGSLSSGSGSLSSCLSEELVPVIRRLISTLERVSQVDEVIGPSPSPECSVNGQIEVVSSTKAPLLGKPGKQDKKKMKDRILEIRDSGGGVEDHRRSTDWGIKIDVANPEPNGQGPGGSAMSVPKGSNSMRVRSSPQYARRMWWRKVRIVLAIDAIVCIILFSIWLGICHGFRCISE